MQETKKKHSIRRRDIVLLCLFILTGLLCGIFLHTVFAHLRISLSPSAGSRLFWIKNRCEFKRGEFALVKPPANDPYLPFSGVTLIKRFSCMPGEKIEKRGLKYLCYRRDGFVETVAVAKTKTKKGKPIKPWEPRPNPLIIPEGYYFMANPNRDSYDSRYLGLIPMKRIIACLTPIP